MGRPLNKKFFGPATAGGNEIKVNFYNGAAVVEGYIVKQIGSKKFRVAAIGTPGESYIRVLTTGKLPATLTGTEMCISVKGDDGETYGVSKIAGRKVTLAQPSATGANALDGTSISWNFTASDGDYAVEIEEAGDDDTLIGTDDSDFTEDA
ncbi:MAG: hypothetical protein ACKVJK_01440 [Methylophagaceae bacterium]|jgi:hypothetical protein|tara:strand:- start:3787 stop:4239 length:453 start_codon:yes stop_codon:yes gene_type:complete